MLFLPRARSLKLGLFILVILIVSYTFSSYRNYLHQTFRTISVSVARSGNKSYSASHGKSATPSRKVDINQIEILRSRLNDSLNGLKWAANDRKDFDTSDLRSRKSHSLNDRKVLNVPVRKKNTNPKGDSAFALTSSPSARKSPYAPPHLNRYTPHRPKSHTPPRHTSHTPPRQNPYTPLRQDAYTPPPRNPYTPLHQKPYTPPRQVPYTPPRQNPYTPLRPTPNTPTPHIPSPPPRQRPYTPPRNSPLTPPRQHPYTPPRLSPYSPAGPTPKKIRPITPGHPTPTNSPINKGIPGVLQTPAAFNSILANLKFNLNQNSSSLPFTPTPLPPGAAAGIGAGVGAVAAAAVAAGVGAAAAEGGAALGGAAAAEGAAPEAAAAVAEAAGLPEEFAKELPEDAMPKGDSAPDSDGNKPDGGENKPDGDENKPDDDQNKPDETPEPPTTSTPRTTTPPTTTTPRTTPTSPTTATTSPTTTTTPPTTTTTSPTTTTTPPTTTTTTSPTTTTTPPTTTTSSPTTTTTSDAATTTGTGACPLYKWNDVSSDEGDFFDMDIDSDPDLSTGPSHSSGSGDTADTDDSTDSDHSSDLSLSTDSDLSDVAPQENSAQSHPKQSAPLPVFDPLNANLSCNNYPTNFNASSQPLAKPDPDNSLPIPKQILGTVTHGFNNSLCASSGAFHVQPNNPFLRDFYAHVDDTFNSLIRGGVVWDPRPECAGIKDASIQGGVQFNSGSQVNLDCATAMTNITHCTSPSDRSEYQGGSLYYKCAIFYWQPTGEQGASSARRDEPVARNNTKHLSSRGGETSAINVNPNSPPAATDPRFSGRSDAWRTSYTSGVQLWSQLQQALKRPPPSTCPALGPPDWSWTRHRNLLTTYFHNECANDGVLSQLDKDAPPPGVQRVCSDTYDHFIQSTKTGLPPNVSNQFRFDNWYSPGAGVIVSESNLARIDPNDLGGAFVGPGSSPQPSSVPASQWYTAPSDWADVVYAAWQTSCQNQKNTPLSVLRYIPHLHIINKATTATTQGMYEPTNVTDQRTDFLPLTPTDADFFAVLGTPNGGGTAKLLTRRVNDFATRDTHGGITKVKTIDSISVAFAVGWKMTALDSFAFSLTDIPPPR